MVVLKFPRTQKPRDIPPLSHEMSIGSVAQLATPSAYLAGGASRQGLRLLRWEQECHQRPLTFHLSSRSQLRTSPSSSPKWAPPLLHPKIKLSENFEMLREKFQIPLLVPVSPYNLCFEGKQQSESISLLRCRFSRRDLCPSSRLLLPCGLLEGRSIFSRSSLFLDFRNGQNF